MRIPFSQSSDSFCHLYATECAITAPLLAFVGSQALREYGAIVKNKQYPQAGRLRANMGNIYFEQVTGVEGGAPTIGARTLSCRYIGRKIRMPPV